MKRQQQVTEIVLTGGPAAGKSTAMAFLTENLAERGFRVFVVPEVASMLINGGVYDAGELPEARDERYWAFQRHYLKLQIALRENFYQMAEGFANATGKRAVVIHDRGLLDSLAYMDEKDFYQLIEEVGLTMGELRDAYDLVIHMVSSARGAEEFYNHDNKARWETLEEAKESDLRTLSAWVGSRKLCLINNSTDFEDKLHRVYNAVLNELGDPGFEIERKFVLHEKPDLSKMKNVVPIEIEQTYLMSGDPEREVRVRKRSQGVAVSYYRTEKAPVEGWGETREEMERKIDERTYNELLSLADPKLKTIKKTRYCFVHKDQYFELDEFHSPDGLYMLELETMEDRKEMLPKELGEYTEVTGNTNYNNYKLAQLGAPKRK